MKKTFDNAKKFIYKNARPLDIARWKFHFENGSKEDVLEALSFYQNEDGGFGHALEADSWNPNSSPIQTWTATEILREINFTDNNHPIIKGILNYLASGKDFDGGLWLNTIESNNEYPHAPWWIYTKYISVIINYNPSACLSGFIIKYEPKNTKLYNLGVKVANEALEFLKLNNEYIDDMHQISCYIRLMQYVEESSSPDVINLKLLKEILKEKVKELITKDYDSWKTSYICKPSQFFNSNDSIFYPDNKEIAEFECKFIIENQSEDGSWHIPWRWGSYEEEWSISKNWWKSNMIIHNILYLRGIMTEKSE